MRMLGKIIPFKTGVTEGWKKLRTEDLHDLYSSSDVIIITKSKWIGPRSSIGEKRNAFKLTAGKPE
jgi:hypothetical protein